MKNKRFKKLFSNKARLVIALTGVVFLSLGMIFWGARNLKTYATDQSVTMDVQSAFEVIAPFSSVIATPDRLEKGGTSNITITLRYKDGSPLVGRVVTIRTEPSEGVLITQPIFPTDTLGRAFAKVYSAGEREIRVIAKDVTDGGFELTSEALVNFYQTSPVLISPVLLPKQEKAKPSPSNSVIIADPVTLLADKISKSKILVVVKDEKGIAMVGKKVTLLARPQDAIETIKEITDQNGLAEFNVLSNSPGSSIISAIVDDIRIGLVEIIFTAIPPKAPEEKIPEEEIGLGKEKVVLAPTGIGGPDEEGSGATGEPTTKEEGKVPGKEKITPPSEKGREPETKGKITFWGSVKESLPEATTGGAAILGVLVWVYYFKGLKFISTVSKGFINKLIGLFKKI